MSPSAVAGTRGSPSSPPPRPTATPAGEYEATFKKLAREAKALNIERRSDCDDSDYLP
ncbi:MAG: hypothetical protein IPK85_05820 [Gemmatimonadetes bacterium]|nr:hypothetical protein [Gemmatimonadota bacterium]